MNNCILSQYSCISNDYLEALKYHPLGILKGDQLDCIGLHLSEMFAKGSATVSLIAIVFNSVYSLLT